MRAQETDQSKKEYMKLSVIWGTRLHKNNLLPQSEITSIKSSDNAYETPVRTFILEDGLIIESAYGEFAITDKAEIASLKEAKVKTKKTSTASKQAKSAVSSDGSLTVDLHIEAIPGGTSVPKGQQLQFQMDTFRRIVRDNANRRGMKITFIHGIGDGILKAAIRKELGEVLALRCSYSVGDPAVTVVSIK